LDGAALSDILTVVNDELPYLRVKIFPAIMGGRRVYRSLETVTNSINFDKDLDVVIMTRGGGSYEDLAVFNSKNIAHLLKEIRVPVISAIGHAKDEVLADTASCFSVSTPTAAIQKIVTNKIKFERKLEHLWSELHVAFLRTISKNHVRLKKIDTNLYGTRNVILENEFKLRLIFQKVFMAQRNLISKCLKIISDNKRRLDLARKNSVKMENTPSNYLTFEKKIEKSRQELTSGQILTIKFRGEVVRVKILDIYKPD
jgi:exodeoxyribonuclease VII large subunit